MKIKLIIKQLIISLLLILSIESSAQIGGGGGLPGGGGGLPGGGGGLPGGGGGLPGGGGGLPGLPGFGGGATDTAIVVDSAMQLSVCSGATIIVIYHTTTTFAPGNKFTAQLVDPFGGLITAPIDLTPSSNGGGIGGLLGGGSPTYTGTVPAGTPTGIYNVRMKSSNSAHTSAAGSTTILFSAPTVSITTTCKHDSIFLTAMTGGTNPALSVLVGLLLPGGGLGGSKTPLLWSTGETVSTIYAGNAGIYSATFTDTTFGCSATSNVTVIKDPIKVDCQMENVKLTSPAKAASYMWYVDTTLTFTSESIVLKNDITNTYHLVTNNPFSCTSINVDPSICKDSNDIYIFVPTMFTPNGDGHNDIFYVRGDNIKELEFSIYNRWGELVFYTDDPKKGWDGTYKGKNVDPSVLGWHLKTKNYLGTEKDEKGFITLTR